MEIIARKEAIKKGLKHYFTGKPCKYGHVSIRITGNGMCCECSEMYYANNKARLKEKRIAERENALKAQGTNKGKCKFSVALKILPWLIICLMLPKYLGLV